mmetsp:Transcript_785/g.3058  ORF Transcript_785/g.3058 Transcript_785/m.3058 type:complete len:252 (-) Transcript_785:308-1063(-)
MPGAFSGAGAAHSSSAGSSKPQPSKHASALSSGGTSWKHSVAPLPLMSSRVRFASGASSPGGCGPASTLSFNHSRISPGVSTKSPPGSDASMLSSRDSHRNFSSPSSAPSPIDVSALLFSHSVSSEPMPAKTFAGSELRLLDHRLSVTTFPRPANAPCSIDIIASLSDSHSVSSPLSPQKVPAGSQLSRLLARSRNWSESMPLKTFCASELRSPQLGQSKRFSQSHASPQQFSPSGHSHGGGSRVSTPPTS